jgi:hypothetical protein
MIAILGAVLGIGIGILISAIVLVANWLAVFNDFTYDF